jgi:hypothetical protein
MPTLTLVPATEGQLKQITRVGQDAVEKIVKEFGLDKDGAQRVHSHGDDFAEVLRVATITALKDLSVSDKYKSEEVPSRYGYHSGYRRPKGLTGQCNKLRELLPGLGFANLDLLGKIQAGEVSLPEGAEGWFAIPNWMANPEIFGATYSQAVQKILDTLKQTRNGHFYNWREGQIVEQQLRRSARTIEFWTKLSESQSNPDILLVPAQFGLRHRGRSTRRATEFFVGNEFGLGAFAVGSMLLTHSERLAHYYDLYVDATGDEFDDPDSDQPFDHAPCFYWDDDRLEFDSCFVDSAEGRYGSASGFLP